MKYALPSAVLSTIALWLIAKAMNIDLVVDPKNGQPAGEIALPFAAAMTFIVSLLAWGLRAVLERLTKRAARIWTVIAGTVLAISFLPVLAVGASGGTKAILALMHIAGEAALIPVLGRTKRAPRTTGPAPR